MFGYKVIGFTPVKLSALIINTDKGPQEDWFSLFKNNARIGNIKIRSSYEKVRENDLVVLERKEPADQELNDVRKREKESLEILTQLKEESSSLKRELTYSQIYYKRMQRDQNEAKSHMEKYENVVWALEKNIFASAAQMQQFDLVNKQNTEVMVLINGSQASQNQVISDASNLLNSGPTEMVLSLNDQNPVVIKFKIMNEQLVRGYGLVVDKPDDTMRKSDHPKGFKLSAKSFLTEIILTKFEHERIKKMCREIIAELDQKKSQLESEPVWKPCNGEVDFNAVVVPIHQKFANCLFDQENDLDLDDLSKQTKSQLLKIIEQKYGVATTWAKRPNSSNRFIRFFFTGGEEQIE